jgi:hypothetical protein
MGLPLFVSTASNTVAGSLRIDEMNEFRFASRARERAPEKHTICCRNLQHADGWLKHREDRWSLRRTLDCGQQNIRGMMIAPSMQHI